MINTFLLLETNKLTRCYTYTFVKEGSCCSSNMYPKELAMHLFDGVLYLGSRINPVVYEKDLTLTSIYDLHMVRYEDSSSWHT